MNNLTKAKANLILDQPFFASILLGLPIIADTSVKTLTTNGDEIKYNPAFVDSLSLNETKFVLAHEVMHCVFQHMYRRGGRSPNRWNQAADYIINDMLTREGVGSMPQGCLYNPALVQQGGGTAEGVYKLLPEEDEGKGPGDPGGAMDDVQDGGQDEASNSQKEAEMRVKIVQAANAAKMAGKLSGDMQRTVKEMTRTRTDWQAVLRRFMTERTKTDWSYAKPKRRFIADDIYLPGLVGERLGDVVVAIDCSGSVDDDTLKRFAAEIKGIVEDVKPEQVHVVYFDHGIKNVQTYGPDDEVVIEGKGGGGTAFSPIFRHVTEAGWQPKACIVLTDLYCDDFGPAPDYPVLWATTASEHAPWGEVLKIEAA